MIKNKELLHPRIQTGDHVTGRSGVPISQVARENGLHPALVARWKKEYLDDPEKAFSGLQSMMKSNAPPSINRSRSRFTILAVASHFSSISPMGNCASS